MPDPTFPMGFLFGIRVANNINGNTEEIEWEKIKGAIAEIAAGDVAIHKTGAELKLQFPNLPAAEQIAQQNIAHDRELAALILKYMEEQDQRRGGSSE